MIDLTSREPTIELIPPINYIIDYKIVLISLFY